MAAAARVRAARRELVRALADYESQVKIATLPSTGGCNAADDLIMLGGDEAMTVIVDGARPAPEVAFDDAERAVRETNDAEESAKAGLVIQSCELIAEVNGKIERESLIARLAKAAHRLVPKASITEMVLEQVEKRRQEAADRILWLKRALTPAVDAAKLVSDLKNFFAERAYLPEGAALLLAYFSLNSWTFSLFETVAYLLLESAVPRCGKSTVIRLLEAVSARSRISTALTEATLFRLVSQELSTLLVDEAEVLESRSERAQALRAIAHEGYKKGSKVPLPGR